MEIVVANTKKNLFILRASFSYYLPIFAREDNQLLAGDPQ